MTDDFEHEVRIVLRRRMRMVMNGGGLGIELVPIECVEVIRPPKRKPTAVFAGDNGGTRADLLRELARWIDDKDDDDLNQLESEMASQLERRS